MHAHPCPSILTDRQERFVHEYLIDQNASAAAERAGYSPKTKGTQAAELMKNPVVKARIAEELGRLFAAIKLTAQDLMQAQAAQLWFDPERLFTQEGKATPLSELTPEEKMAVSVYYEERRGEVVKRVRQVPRHIALAGMWRRYDGFQKLQGQVFGFGAVAGNAGVRKAQALEWPELFKDEEVGGKVVPMLDAEAMEKSVVAGAEGVAAATIEKEPEPIPSVEHAPFPDTEMRLRANGGGECDGVEEVTVTATKEASVAVETVAVVEAAPAQQHLAQAPVASNEEKEQATEPAPSPTAAQVTAEAPAPQAEDENGVVGAVEKRARELLCKRKGGRLQRLVEAVKGVVGKKEEKQQQAPAPAKGDQRKGPRTPEELKDPSYSFRDDPDWMWGGRRAPTPEPEPNPVMLRQLADAQAAKQHRELFGVLQKRPRIRPGAVMPDGASHFTPPHPQDRREQYARGTEFQWSCDREDEFGA